MQKKYRLKNSRVFNYLHKRGTSNANKLLVLVYAPSKFNLHVGFVVSKKVGKAVVRNKVRRRLREAFRALIPFLKDYHNFVIIARSDCANADFSTLANSLYYLIKKAQLFEKEIDKSTALRLGIHIN